MDSLTAYRLMKDIARESREEYEWEQAYELLADEYSMTVESVMSFHERYWDVIDEVIEDLFPEMWVTSKDQRMRDYQIDVDKYNEILQHGWDKAIALEKRYIKRYVAEELGQLPSRFSQKTETEEEETDLNYRIEGVDLSDLR